MKDITTLFRQSMAKGRLPALTLLLCLSPTSHASTILPEVLIGTAQGFLEFSVEEYLQSSGIQARHEIQVNRLDPRLRLAECDQELSATLESPAQPVGRVTVRVRCDGSSPWTVFVPAQVRIFREVLVSTRPLQRSQTIGEDDVSLVERDIGPLGKGYLTEPEQASGRKLTRAILQDQVLTPALLELAELVRKGDHVTIRAQSGKVTVHMSGEALSAGSEGQQVRVRNLTSRRIVKAQVVGPGIVEVAM